MKNITLSLISILTLSTTAMAETFPAYGTDSYQAVNSASNTDRQGFHLALGLGVANTNLDNYYYYGDNLSSSGLAGSFEIGYAPTNQFSLYLMDNINFGSNQDAASNIGAVAFNYYFEDRANTFYFTGGVGASSYDSDSAEVAGLVGIGYAIDKVELELDGVFNQYYDENMLQVFFTVSYRFF